MVGHDFRGDVEIGAQERRAKFRDKLLLGVPFVSMHHAAKVSRKALVVLGPVGQLMREGRGVAGVGTSQAAGGCR